MTENFPFNLLKRLSASSKLVYSNATSFPTYILYKTLLSMLSKYFITTPSGSLVRVSPSGPGSRPMLSSVKPTTKTTALFFYSKLMSVMRSKSSCSKTLISKSHPSAATSKSNPPKSLYSNTKLNSTKSPWWALKSKSSTLAFLSPLNTLWTFE
jgi:hypothetical protein